MRRNQKVEEGGEEDVEKRVKGCKGNFKLPNSGYPAEKMQVGRYYWKNAANLGVNVESGGKRSEPKDGVGKKKGVR